MKTLYFFLIFLSGIRLNAQDCTGSIHAFSKMAAVGNPPADLGNPLPNEPVYFFYTDAPSNKKPVITNAWINGRAYTVSLTNTGTTAAEAGKKKSNSPVIKIKASKGKVLWLAELTLSGIKKTIPSQYKNLKNGIVLIEIRCGKKKYYKAIPITELTSIDTA
jgi:hypothetical protein